MGERHHHGGASDRRVARPGDKGPGLDALLAAAVIEDTADPEGEARAVTAFLAVRDQGALAARTRRRDDWRPREKQRARRALRAALAVMAASVTLGGVAVAAIESSPHHDGDKQSRTRPSNSASDRPASESAHPAVPGSSAQADPSGHPSRAQDTEAHCRAYEAVAGQGKALDSKAWQRFITAAGGEDNVAAYCAAQLGRDTGPTKKAHGAHATTGADDGVSGTASATPKPKKSKGKS